MRAPNLRSFFCVSSQQDFLTKISTRKISQLGAELTRCLDKAHLPSAMCAPAVQSRVEEPCGDLALGWRPAPPHNGFDPQLLPAIAIFAPSPSSSPSHCSQADHQLHQLQSPGYLRQSLSVSVLDMVHPTNSLAARLGDGPG